MCMHLTMLSLKLICEYAMHTCIYYQLTLDSFVEKLMSKCIWYTWHTFAKPACKCPRIRCVCLAPGAPLPDPLPRLLHFGLHGHLLGFGGGLRAVALRRRRRQLLLRARLRPPANALSQPSMLCLPQHVLLDGTLHTTCIASLLLAVNLYIVTCADASHSRVTLGAINEPSGYAVQGGMPSEAGGSQARAFAQGTRSFCSQVRGPSPTSLTRGRPPSSPSGVAPLGSCCAPAPLPPLRQASIHVRASSALLPCITKQ